jgi:hypothetical protein
MLLKQLINKSTYGSIGYIDSQESLQLLERYILHNLETLQEFNQVVIAANYPKDIDVNALEYLKRGNTQLWKKYFATAEVLHCAVNRGHSFGTADLDDIIFDHCKQIGVEWLCKSTNDMLFDHSILDREVQEADFYYMNGVGYGGVAAYNSDFDAIIREDFYPQTNFYFINVNKTDYLNDKKHIEEVYNNIQNILNYSGKAWEYGFRSCEALLKECVERNNLFKNHLISEEKYRILLEIVRDNFIHDSSHKNIMIDGICHYHYSNHEVISI